MMQPTVTKKKSTNNNEKWSPATSSYWYSWLTHKQSVKFTLHDFDWIHLRRLENQKKEEHDAKLKKLDDKRRFEFYDFLENSGVDENHPLYLDFFESEENNSDSESSIISTESEDLLLKRLVAIKRKEYCEVCDGKCKLFQRKSQRYFDYLNRHFLRSLRALRKENTRSEVPPLITEEEINALYGKTIRDLCFWHSYKIPKISDNNSRWSILDTPELEDHGSNTYPEDLECDLSEGDWVAEQFSKKPSKTRRRKRQTKFDYGDKYSSSSELSSDDEDLFAAHGLDCIIDMYPENSLSDEECSVAILSDDYLPVRRNSSGEHYPDEDLLHLFPEDAGIRLPK